MEDECFLSYPTEIHGKRKAYTFITKALKEKGIRFQMLYPANSESFSTRGQLSITAWRRRLMT